MSSSIFILVIGAVLLILSIIDWKFKAIPSIFLTAMLFVVAMLNPTHLWFGAMGFIIAYLLYEADFFSGVADIKIMTLVAFMVSSVTWFFALIILTVVLGLLWKVLIKWRIPKAKDTAFIPVFFFIYVALYILGGFS